MFIKLYDEIPEEAKTIREAVFIKGAAGRRKSS